MKFFYSLSTASQKNLSNTHESSRKDIERACGVIVQRNHVIKNNFRGWHVKDIASLIECAIIINNVIVKECMSASNFDFEVMLNYLDQPEVEDDAQLNFFGAVSVNFNDEVTTSIGARLETMHANANYEHAHDLLKADLIEEFENSMCEIFIVC